MVKLLEQQSSKPVTVQLSIPLNDIYEYGLSDITLGRISGESQILSYDISQVEQWFKDKDGLNEFCTDFAPEYEQYDVVVQQFSSSIETEEYTNNGYTNSDEYIKLDLTIQITPRDSNIQMTEKDVKEFVGIYLDFYLQGDAEIPIQIKYYGTYEFESRDYDGINTYEDYIEPQVIKEKLNLWSCIYTSYLDSDKLIQQITI